LFKLSAHRLSLSLSCCAAILLSACGGGGDTAGSEATAASASATPAASTGASNATGATPQTASASASSAPTPYGQDANLYTLSFNDEFDSFNSNVWNDHIWYESANATKNFTVENGALKIWPQRDASGKFFNRTIDTDGKYYQTYGYFEVEAKLPKGKGT